MNQPQQTSPGQPPPLLGNEVVAAYEATIAHHGNVIHTFSSNFVNIFALFNAGGFSASMVILPTELGARILASHPYVLKWIATLFIIGFIASSLLMISIFQYSLHKYWEYRNFLATGHNFVPISPGGSQYKFVTWAWFFAGTSVTATCLAIGLSLVLFYIL